MHALSERQRKQRKYTFKMQIEVSYSLMVM